MMNKTHAMTQILHLNKSTHWIKPINNLHHLIILSPYQRLFSLKLLEDKTGIESWTKGHRSKDQPRTCRQISLCLVQPRKLPGLINPALAAAELQLSWARLCLQHTNTTLAAPQGTATASTQCWIFMETLEYQGGLTLKRQFSGLFSIKLTFFWRFECFQASCGFLLLCQQPKEQKRRDQTNLILEDLWCSLFSHLW